MLQGLERGLAVPALFALVTALSACAAAPPPCPELPAPAPVEKAAVEPGSRDVMRIAIAKSVERAGFTCKREPSGMAICTKNDLKIVPEAVEDDIPWAMLIATFFLKKGITCDRVHEEFRRIGPDTRLVCNQQEGLVTFFVQSMVPARGLTDDDVARLLGWFKAANQTVVALMLDRGLLE
jgi:hypothetical protein